MNMGWCLTVLALTTACGVSREKARTSAPDVGALRAELAAHPNGEIAAVHRLWSEYLASQQIGCELTRYWLASEATWTSPDGQRIARCVDLAGSMLSTPESHEILRIVPWRETREATYRITTRFRFDTPQLPVRTTPPATVTMFAVWDGDAWKLSGALGQLTRTWRRETVGPFTYVVRPGHRFSRTRALRAVAFADSLATALGVPKLRPMEYYLLRDADEMLRVTGYESDSTYGVPGGRAMPGVILSGDTTFGEMHGHEIVHHVMQPLHGPRLHIVASEGVPTWLGGTRGMHYADAVIALRTYLAAHPLATLDSVIASNAHPMHNPGAALLAAMVNDAAGAEGIRRFLDSGPSMSDLKSGVARILGKPWPDVVIAWRRRAQATS